MSVLKKIRENVGLVIAIIALSLFAFIFSSVYKQFGKDRDDTIGEVNGASIDFPALDAKYEMAQRNNPNATTTPEQYQLKEQAWQSLVREIYYAKEWEKDGIGISDDELMMMFTGQIYHPYVVNSGYFADSIQKYNPAMVQRVFAQADQIDLNDPRVPDEWRKWKMGLIDLREIISLDRRSNKWQSAIKGSALLSDNEVKTGYEQQQRSADISYLYIPYASIPDEQVKVTDGDRNDYYNKHRESYRMSEEQARIQYAYFTVTPSRSDSANTRLALAKLIPDFLTSATPFDFASTSSDERAMDTVAKPLAQLPAALASVNGRTDTVVGPILGATGLQLMRIVKVDQDSVNANVQLRHILVAFTGPTSQDSTASKSKADSLLKVVNADKSQFAIVAMTASSDQTTKMNGGDLGWVAENAFGEQFDKALKAAKIGVPFVTSSAQGYHVVEMLDRSNKLYSFATITRVVNAGTETNDSVFKRASMFHGEILGGADMEKSKEKYTDARILNSGNVGPGTYTLLGLNAGRAVVVWAFKNEQGAVCDKIIEAEDAFVVAKLEYKADRGYASVEGLKDNLEFETLVRNAVKAKQIKVKLGKATDLQGYSTNYGLGGINGEAKEIHFSTNEVSGLGNEPKVVGKAFGMQLNAVSVPLAGNAGVYVIKLNAVREPAALDDMMKMFTTQSLRASKEEKSVNALFMGMRELSDIRDLRYKADF